MSRRKQAKPRAFLKLGDEPNDGAVGVSDVAANPTLELLDPKEELFSDVESQDEQEEDVCSQLEQQSSDTATPGHPHTLDTAQRVSAMDTDDAAESGQDATKSSLKHSTKVVEVATALPTKTVAAHVASELKLVPQATVELNEDIEDDDIDYDDDYDDDEEDIHSLDSFYSDMYSTHTSSSYSPSISDGTITPNSLLHHHHQHLPPHHLSAPPHQQHEGDDPSGGAQTQRLRRLHAAKANGAEGAEGDDVDNDNDLLADESHHKNNGNGNAARIARLAGDAAAGVEQLKRQARHAMKMPTKLRKIDRDALAGKFDKSTGDGIKSGSNADGSYQCQFCDKSFPRLGYLKKHEQSHAEHLPFKCDYCARLFKHKRSRDRHTKLHTGDRRYRCPHCEAAFSRSDHLKIHMKTHDNQKPFQCTICNRGYNTAAALTSHMQNHKKQAAILAAGGNPHALTYSPRSTGSASSNGSLHKRRYAMAIASADSSPSRLDYPKRLRAAFLSCSFCTKADFGSLDQLNAHIQSMHEKELTAAPQTPEGSAFQLACEYCTMKLPNIPAMFQHMRSAHLDRLTSPNSYFEHFNRLAASGTFSPRLVSKSLQRVAAMEESPIKVEQQLCSPKNNAETAGKPEEEPTDLSQNKRRSKTPSSPTTTNASPPPPHAEQPPGVFFCNQCNAGLPDFESFRNHLKSHLAQGLNLVCHHCGLALREQAEYEHHVISHYLIANSEYNCAGSCNKSYVKPEELQKHLLEQHVVPMYKCALCADLFESKVAIQVHFACAHSAETKLLRCSACMEVFRAEADFNLHVKTRHQAAVNGNSGAGANSLQCMFCRTVCGSELEMHFHLAAHARQFRCPSCPETFHVEFLLDRHMQSQHGGNERAATVNKEVYEEQQPHVGAPNNALSPMNSLYVNALFGGKAPLAAQNNNNSILDYNVAFAAQLNKGLFPAAGSAAGKFYSPLQVDTSAMKHAHPALVYGLSQRYFDTNRTLMDMYAQHQQGKVAAAAAAAGNYFVSPKQPSSAHQTHQAAPDSHSRTPNELAAAASPLSAAPSATTTAAAGYSCDICERNDFRTEAEVHSHRKIVHNMKTGVSLRCAYCSGNFKSRSELEHHMKTCHNSTGKHKCLICDEIFPSPAILAEHKLQHSKVGQSGKCSHCAQPLGDLVAFKAHLAQHNNEAQMPVQCVCCRQSLHSDFEISLHAKFHTKSSSMPESMCALCLMEPVSNASSEAKVCEKCCRKHNLREKYKNRSESYASAGGGEVRPYLENRCNLCKMVLPHASKLQEHLVEHTFAGCEERGYICYICSAVFTAPSGLLNHMHEHGLNARPYDCNLCTEKYFFRAELDHHMLEHELRDATALAREAAVAKTANKDDRTFITRPEQEQKRTAAVNLPMAEVKQELLDADNKSNAGDEDEYIEVEQVPEAQQTQQSPLQRQQEAAVVKCETRKMSAEQQQESRAMRGAEA